jgi:hypothetical protein
MYLVFGIIRYAVRRYGLRRIGLATASDLFDMGMSYHSRSSVQ